MTLTISAAVWSPDQRLRETQLMSPLRGLNNYCLLTSVMSSLRDYIPFDLGIHFSSQQRLLQGMLRLNITQRPRPTHKLGERRR